MLFYKKILIFVLILIFLYLVYKVFDKNYKKKEMFTLFDETNVINNPLPGVSTCKNTSLPLLQYCIKSSYNSAFNGKIISLDALTNVLSHGCRFIDLAIKPLTDNNNIAYVIDDNTNNNTLTNSILLTDVLSKIAQSGFMSPCPNPGDPLFLHLRIISDTKSNPKIYTQIADTINSTLSTRLYKQKVTQNTILSDIMGKVIIVIDLALSPDYGDLPDCNGPDYQNTGLQCYNLKNYVNIESNSEYVHEYEYNDLVEQRTFPPHINMDNTINQTVINIVTPGSINGIFGYISNPNPDYTITNYGVQIHLMRFYMNDSNLNIYEQDFSNNGSAFVPMATMINYITTVKE